MSKNKSYKFSSVSTKSIYDIDITNNSNEKISHFFQICTYKNPLTDKYIGRRFTIKNADFSSIENILLNEDQFKKLFNNLSDNEYKCFPVYNLDNIAYPNLSDVIVSQSDLLINNDFDTYDGFAPFK